MPDQFLNSLVHSVFVDKSLIGFVLLFEGCLLFADETVRSVKILPNNIVKQVLFIQFSIFAGLFDPVLEKVDILARSHFDLKLIVKFLEVAINRKSCYDWF